MVQQPAVLQDYLSSLGFSLPSSHFETCSNPITNDLEGVEKVVLDLLFQQQ